MFIVVYLTETDGFTAYQQFDTYDKAVAWAKQEGYFDECAIIEGHVLHDTLASELV